MGGLPSLALVRGGATTIAKCDMIIACPACGTRYAVPDAAIGSEGRTVRCAKCKHSWFQDPPEPGAASPAAPAATAPATAQPAPAQPTPAPAAAAPPVQAPPPPQSEPEPAPSVGRPAPAPEPQGEGPSVSHWRTPETEAERGYTSDDATLAAQALRRGFNAQGEPVAPPPPPAPPPAARSEPASPAFAEPAAPAGEDYADPPFADDVAYDDDADDGGSQFDYRAPFTRRRNPARMWTLAALLFAALAGAAAVAINQYGPPEWLPIERPTFGIGRPGLELDFPKTNLRKESLENGEVIFRVRGTITNTSSESLDVPNLLVVFSDRKERNIGDWVVVPSKRRLAPGETITVTQAMSNIPPLAATADLGWAPR